MPDMWLDVDTAITLPVNVFPLTDDTDMKTRETAVAYNAAGMDLVWNFQTPGGTTTQTAVTPTTAGDYDWTHSGDAMYKIEMPASGGASINNNTEGFGWFTGICTGVMPWRSPIYGFRAAGLNDLMVESAFSTIRGLSGTALPNAAAEAAGGLFTRGTGAGQINQETNGRIDVNVHAAAGVAWTSGAITAASIATGALTAAKFAAGAFDAVWTVTTRTLSSISALASEIRTALGLGSANLDTQLSSLSSGQTTINNNVLTVAGRLVATPIKTGAVVADGSNSATTFKTNLTEASNEHWKESFIHITSGTLDGAVRKIDGFNAATDFITVTPAFPSTPANGVTFSIINR